MRFITSHFSCLTCISFYLCFGLMLMLGARVWWFLCQTSLFQSCFAYPVWWRRYSTVSFSVICYLHREALCGCVDILLAVAIQCSEKFFMCVWWSSWKRPWALGSDPLSSPGFYSAELCGFSGHLQDIPCTTVACLRRVGKSIYH